MVMSNGALITYSFGEFNGVLTKVEVDSSTLQSIAFHSIIAGIYSPCHAMMYILIPYVLTVAWGNQYVVVALENKLLLVLQPKKESSLGKTQEFLVCTEHGIVYTMVVRERKWGW